MSEEIRGLLHATAGQGRTELIAPPRVPAMLPQLVEYDRTFAYAKHTWASGVGAPRRITAAAFAATSQKEQTNALSAPSHWQIRVTVPDGWNHVGILPAPAAGDRAWHYPATPARPSPPGPAAQRSTSPCATRSPLADRDPRRPAAGIGHPAARLVDQAEGRLGHPPGPRGQPRRPAPLPTPPPGARPAWGTLGAAIDHRLRYAFTCQQVTDDAVHESVIARVAHGAHGRIINSRPRRGRRDG